MYNIDEIKVQNQQDCWSMMYMYIARGIMDVCGRAGEGVIREAVRRYGMDRGAAMKERLEKAGFKTNLKTLFTIGSDCTVDPRFRENLLREDEQVRLWEVYTCPLADFWKEYGEEDLGHYFCEQCTHACVKAFTDGKAQTNLSKKLTHGNNFCRFSVYYRPANLDPDKRGASFAEFDPGYQEPDPSVLKPVEAKASINLNMLKLYYYLLEVATERFGNEGASAVAQGLQGFAEDCAEMMKVKAEHTLKQPDAEFLGLNFPMALCSDEEPFWKDHDKYNAKKIMDSNFYAIFNQALGL